MKGEFECRAKGMAGQPLGCACLPADTVGCACIPDADGRCIRCKCLTYEVRVESAPPLRPLANETPERK
jgi:hypothetical protein